MKTPTIPHDGRPAFTLEPYTNPAPLPSNMRLTEESELVGHTIAALITNPYGPAARRANSDCMVIVTQTRCWLVLQAEGDGDDGACISVRDSSYELSHALSDYLSAHDMLMAGLIGHSEYAVARAAEDAKASEALRLKDVERAASLRRELALLEATAK